MSIPFAKRIQIRQLLNRVQELTNQINEIREKVRVGKKGVVSLLPGEYADLLEEVRRVEYIMLQIAAAHMGLNLKMPPPTIPASQFREAMDTAILEQLEELNNEGRRIWTPDAPDSPNGNM